jgi:hypothetical protein
MKAERKRAVTRKRPYRQTCRLDVESGAVCRSRDAWKRPSRD